MEVAQGIHRSGDRWVNWYIVEEGGRLTVIDAGLPKQWGRLMSQLAELGKSLDDIEAVLLTHAHPDHMGFAERARDEADATVRVHELDANAATGKEKFAMPNPLKLPMWRASAIRFSVSML